MNTQPQLLNVALNPRDVIYTPDAIARDIVAYFKPTGRILEPCAGDGAFLKYLPPDTEWCEIEKGRDFFAEHRHFDWIIGNPPYSNISGWFEHSFSLADDVVFLVPLAYVFSGWSRIKIIFGFGGIRTIYLIGTMDSIEWRVRGGTPAAAVHFQRNYRGGTFTVFRSER